MFYLINLDAVTRFGPDLHTHTHKQTQFDLIVFKKMNLQWKKEESCYCKMQLELSNDTENGKSWCLAACV